MIQRIAINTGGGDAPGLNAVIQAVTFSAYNRGWDVYGIKDGFNGLLMPDEYPEDGIMQLRPESVSSISKLGGTILGTTNRGNPMSFPVKNENGEWITVDRTDELIQKMRDFRIDALVSIGGDGSLSIANAIAKKGFPVIGVPKTIDNDLDKTVVTFGFDSAVSFATECIDRLHSTADSHKRIIVVEVMGRYAGWIALHAGVAAGANAILIPEIPFDYEKLSKQLLQSEAKTKRKYSIVVVAEGAKEQGGSVSVKENIIGRLERIGGIGEQVTEVLQSMTKKESRLVVLGHLLRGGSPTATDRLLSLRFGAAAVRALANGSTGCMVALDPPNVNLVPLEDAVSRMKCVPIDSDSVQTARELGILFGD